MPPWVKNLEVVRGCGHELWGRALASGSIYYLRGSRNMISSCHVREIGHILHRLNADLKYIFDAPEYCQQDFRTKLDDDYPDALDSESG